MDEKRAHRMVHLERSRCGWTLTQPLKFENAIQPGPDGTAQVAFPISPKDDKGAWQIKSQ